MVTPCLEAGHLGCVFSAIWAVWPVVLCPAESLTAPTDIWAHAGLAGAAAGRAQLLGREGKAGRGGEVQLQLVCDRKVPSWPARADLK